MSTTRIQGLRALVTGASEGIGRATAMALARQGCDLVLLARDGARLEALCAEISVETGVDAVPVVCDVTDTDTLRRVLHEADDARPIGIAVVNAGVGLYGPFAAAEWSDVRTVLSTNIDGAFATVHAVLPRMLARRSGSIVLISSVLGKRAIAWNAAYCASKYALHGLADAIRLEAAPHGVHVGVVCPATTSTEFFNRMTYTVQQTRRRSVPSFPPGKVADAIVSCVQARRREVVVSPGGKLLAFFGMHLPRLTDFILSRAVPRPDGH